MAQKATVAGADIDLGFLGLNVPTADVQALPATETTGRNIVLVNSRQNLLIQHADGKYYAYTLQVNVAREPLDDDELTRVQAKAKEQAASKAAREATEQAKRDREIKMAVTITQESERAAGSRIANLQNEIDRLKRATGQA